MARQPSKKAPAPSKGAKPSDDGALIRELATLLDETNLTEIEVERAGLRIRVARTMNVAAAVPALQAAPAGVLTPIAATPLLPPVMEASKQNVVTSPMVGTAYRASEPGGKPFVDIGSRVAIGDTLLIIEAMKTMNQIPSTRAGTVTQILVEDGQPVEFGESLVIVE